MSQRGAWQGDGRRSGMGNVRRVGRGDSVLHLCVVEVAFVLNRHGDEAAFLRNPFGHSQGGSNRSNIRG